MLVYLLTSLFGLNQNSVLYYNKKINSFLGLFSFSFEKFVFFFFCRKKDGVAIKSIKSLAGRTSEESKDGISSLVISHSTEQDAGNYTCIAFVKQTEITNATVRVVCK